MFPQESDAFSFNFRIFGYFGFWRSESREEWKMNLYRVYRVVSMIGITFFTILQTMDLYVVRRDIRKFNYNLCGTTCSLFTVYKSFVMLFNMKRIETVRNNLDNNLDMAHDDEDHSILRRSSLEMMKVTKTFFGLVIPTVLCWTITPLVEDSKEKVLPLRIWFPLDVNQSPVYEIVYAYEFVALWIFVVNVLCIDLIVYGFVIQVCAQFEILAKNVRNLGESLEVDHESCGKIRDERERSLTGKLKMYVRHHQAILREAKEIEQIFNSAVLVHMTGCTVLICVVCFDIIVNSPQLNSQMFRQMGYVGSTLFDVFWYCLYGTRLAEKSLEVSKAIYGSPWYKMNASNRRMLHIFMNKTLKSPRITAGKLFPINLTTYLNILKISYNMLAVLRQTAGH